MDISEDTGSFNEENEEIDPLQYSDYEDGNNSLLTSRSEGGDSESVASYKVKKVRFSDQVDYCNFYTDTVGNDIDTLPEELLDELPSGEFEVEELASEIMSLNISTISEGKEEISETVSPKAASNLNSHELIDLLESEEHQSEELVREEEEEEEEEEEKETNDSLSNVKSQRNGNILKQKQTKRLNDLLKTDLNNSKAKDFKTAVYRAWTAVKKETKENLPIFVSNKLEDEQDQKSVNLAYVLWKKSKDKELKCAKKVGEKKLLSSNVSLESVKTEKEDNEMAFISWKKRKDELLRQETYNRIQNERNAARIALMNKEEKRKDGESAFLAWKAHKAHLHREEKKKVTFYKEREKQSIEEKETRDVEALYMYNLWVKSKSCGNQRKWSKQTLKPPWYPPGNK